MPPTTPVQTLTPCQAMQAEVAKYGDWDANIMQAVAQAENTTCNPLRHNLTASETHRDRNGNVMCVGSYGVLQVGCLHYSEGEDVNDLATNVRLAHQLWQNRQKWGNGYEAWTQYTKGKYKQFLQ